MPEDTTRIECALRLLLARRAQIDADELALIEQARTDGWTWERIGVATGTSHETARRRHAALLADSRSGALPKSPTPPGDILRATLKHLGLKQAELAQMTGLSPKHINQVVKGHVSISVPIAIKLEDATGIPAMLWNTLEAAYRDALARRCGSGSEATR